MFASVLVAVPLCNDASALCVNFGVCPSFCFVSLYVSVSVSVSVSAVLVGILLDVSDPV